MRSRRRLQSESEESVENSVKNVTKLLKGLPWLRDTQVRNTNTPLSCLQGVQEAVKEETRHHREGGGKENPPARLVSKISEGGRGWTHARIIS